MLQLSFSLIQNRRRTVECYGVFTPCFAVGELSGEQSLTVGFAPIVTAGLPLFITGDAQPPFQMQGVRKSTGAGGDLRGDAGQVPELPFQSDSPQNCRCLCLSTLRLQSDSEN